MIHIVLKIISVILIMYGISIFMITSGSRFYLFWFVSGLLIFLFSELLRTGFFHRIPKGFLYCIGGVAVTFAVIFLIITGLICSRFRDRAGNDPEYLIVLGAQMKEDGPSVILRSRLNAAGDYLRKHPDTKAVLSGGQGSDEPVTEAAGMKAYLSDIDQDRLLLEERSVNTRQNLENSLAMTGNLPAAIVTNGFHMYRALMLAKKAGYRDVSGIAAASNPYHLPNYVVREVLAIIKEFMVGYM